MYVCSMDDLVIHRVVFGFKTSGKGRLSPIVPSVFWMLGYKIRLKFVKTFTNFSLILSFKLQF